MNGPIASAQKSNSVIKDRNPIGHADMFWYTKKKLAADIEKIARQHNPDYHTTYLPDEDTVSVYSSEGPDNPIMVFTLDNLFQVLKIRSRQERLKVIAELVSKIHSRQSVSADELIDSLRLRVRTSSEVALRKRFYQLIYDDRLETLLFPKGPTLSLELMSDSDDSVSSVCASQLKEMGVGIEEALQISSAALVRMTDDDQWLKADESIWMSSYHDDYDFARLVSLGKNIRYPFDAPPIAFVPSHSVCLITNCRDEGVLNRMVEMGYQGAEGHRHFSNLLWMFSNGRWEQWNPERGSSGFYVAQLQTLRETLLIHREQKDYLERLVKNRGEDVFVADLQHLQQDGKYETLCVYTLDVPSLLPQAEKVAVADADAEEGQSLIGVFTWDDFSSALGPESLMEMPDEDPPVYQVLSKLSNAQLRNLKNLADTDE